MPHKTIPQVRKALAAIADCLRWGLLSPQVCAGLIDGMLPELERRPQHRRGGNESVTRPDPEAVRDLADACPGATHAQLATMLGTNSARISEALHGKRKA